MGAIVDLAAHTRMTDDEYQRRREELRATYGDSAPERSGLFDQALARLFSQSRWTQEQLAQVEGKGQQWASRHLLFGQFLEFTPTGVNRKNITERRFRSYWNRTDGDNERQRFSAVLRLMDEETTLSKSHMNKKPIGAAIKTTCGSGQWFKFTTIHARVQGVLEAATAEDVRAVLSGMVKLGWYNVLCEKKGGDVYRIVIGGKQKVDLSVLKQELGPIIEQLKAEGRKNMATMSPATVAHLTFQLERVLDRLTHEHRADASGDGEE